MTKRDYFAEDLRRRYGITRTMYEELLESQQHCCAICYKLCPTGRRLAVDHDHTTGQVRGLICGRCNVGLGMMLESQEVLRNAAEYLDSWTYSLD